MVKANYTARICYDDSFREEMQLFLEFIAVDKRLDKMKLKNSEQRFSAAMRELIKWYNGERRNRILRVEAKKNVQT